MRIARQAAGLNPSGEPIIPFRSPLYLTGENDSPHSFRDWRYPDPLPTYDDHVSGIHLSQPFSASSVLLPERPERDSNLYHLPFHPAFGEQSVVKVHLPSRLRQVGETDLGDSTDKPNMDSLGSLDELFFGEEDPGLEHQEQDVEMNESSHSDGSGDNDTTPPREDIPFTIHDPGSGESEFSIYLEFPGQDRPRMKYRVYTSMPVRVLYSAIAGGLLDCDDVDIRIFVDDACLLHMGTITDRHFPDNPEVPTVFLYPNCTAFVRRTVGSSSSNPPAEPKTRNTTLGLDDESISIPQRRISTRVPIPRLGRLRDPVPSDMTAVPRRPVGDRWYYDPVVPVAPDGSRESSSAVGKQLVSRIAPDTVTLAPNRTSPLMLGPPFPPAPLTKQQTRQMLKQFHAEGRRRRRMFRKELQRDWESQVSPAFDQENDHPDAKWNLIDEESAYHDFMSSSLARFDDDLTSKRVAFLDDLSCASLTSDNGQRSFATPDVPDALILARTAELWAGLRRVYFGEVEESSV